MGQPVATKKLPSATAGRVRFEINRSLTGQGHERYESAEDARGSKPADVLARRLFATGAVTAVHVYGNMITLSVTPSANESALFNAVEDLYQYWTPGKVPPTEEELMAQVPKSAAPAPSGDAGASASSDPNLAKIPPALLARSQAALAKARAKQG
jgi:hypothetical protein